MHIFEEDVVRLLHRAQSNDIEVFDLLLAAVLSGSGDIEQAIAFVVNPDT